jgi:hypothetical protein
MCKLVFVLRKQASGLLRRVVGYLLSDVSKERTAFNSRHYPTTRRNNQKIILNNDAVAGSDHCVRIVKNVFLSDYLIFLMYLVCD